MPLRPQDMCYNIMPRTKYTNLWHVGVGDMSCFPFSQHNDMLMSADQINSMFIACISSRENNNVYEVIVDNRRFLLALVFTPGESVEGLIALKVLYDYTTGRTAACFRVDGLPANACWDDLFVARDI